MPVAAQTGGADDDDASVSDVARAAYIAMLPYHDFFWVTPPDTKSGKPARFQSYRAPQTGDLPRFGENVFGFHFRGRYVPCEQRTRLTQKEKAWLAERFDARVEEDCARRQHRAIDVRTILTTHPTQLGVAALKRKAEEEAQPRPNKKTKKSEQQAAAAAGIGKWFAK